VFLKLCCRRQVMVGGGGGEKISPTSFVRNVMIKMGMTNRSSHLSIRLSPDYFYGDNAKAFAAAIAAVKSTK
jgi:hypothetical protein